MSQANFIDYVKIYCRSGKGGAGSMHFHRAKYLPKGGPDGGDGGRGGHIILKGNRNLWTLLHLKYQKHLFATDGGNGGESRSFGKDGTDKVIEVPCGTVAYDGTTGEYLCEIREHNEKIVLLKGGRGGLGNWHFRTATNQAPRYAQPGEPAEEKEVILQLKVLASTQKTPNGEEYNSEHQKIVKNLNQKLYESQCQLQESQRTTSMLQEKLKEKDNEIAKLLDVLQSMESEDNSLEEQIDDTSYPFVARERIVIFGGHDTFIKTMKQLIVGNVKFVKKETAFDEAWITNADYIWIQTNAISHSMYGKIMSVAKRCHKNVSYFKHSGAKSCLNQIVQKCESQNGET